MARTSGRSKLYFMSWELVRERTAPCSCGKGTVTEADYSDKWSRSETRVLAPLSSRRAIFEVFVKLVDLSSSRYRYDTYAREYGNMKAALRMIRARNASAVAQFLKSNGMAPERIPAPPPYNPTDEDPPVGDHVYEIKWYFPRLP